MDVVLEARSLSKVYPVSGGRRAHETFKAVDDVSLEVGRSQTLALIGESGAGKSTLGRMMARLIEPDDGQVLIDGVDLTKLSSRDMRRMRNKIQFVFQQPFASLDPLMTIATSVAEPLRALTPLSRRERDGRVEDLLLRVGLSVEYFGRYPHELSGGQLQRVAIARALSTDPEIIVCDEPVAALDVSIRGQVLNLLRSLQAERDLAIVFITHDLALVRVLADHVVIMRDGRVVERGSAADIWDHPRDAYTQGLRDSVPEADPDRRRIVRSAPSTEEAE